MTGYCLCGSLKDDVFMIQCGLCNRWCHGFCVGQSSTSAASHKEQLWRCPLCYPFWKGKWTKQDVHKCVESTEQSDQTEAEPELSHDKCVESTEQSDQTEAESELNGSTEAHAGALSHTGFDTHVKKIRITKLSLKYSKMMKK